MRLRVCSMVSAMIIALRNFKNYRDNTHFLERFDKMEENINPYEPHSVNEIMKIFVGVHFIKFHFFKQGPFGNKARSFFHVFEVSISKSVGQFFFLGQDGQGIIEDIKENDSGQNEKIFRSKTDANTSNQAKEV